MNLDEALAREAIRDLVTRYNSYSDAGRFDPLFELFAPDAVMETGARGEQPQRMEGLEQIKSIFTGAERTMRDGAAGALTFVRHHTATHQIDLLDADHATGRLYFAVLTDIGLDHWGRYVDRYVRRDVGWQFAERRVTVDGRSAQSLFLPSEPTSSRP